MSNQYGTNVYNKYLDALTTNAANAASTRYQAEDSSNQYRQPQVNSIYGTRTTEWGNIDARNLQEALAQNSFNQTQDPQKSTQQQARTVQPVKVERRKCFEYKQGARNSTMGPVGADQRQQFAQGSLQ